MTELTVNDPATGEAIARLALSDAGALVATARAAHTGWERTAPGAAGRRIEGGRPPPARRSRRSGAAPDA